LALAGALAIGGSTARAGEDIHWMTGQAPVQTAGYIEVPEDVPQEPKIMLVGFRNHKPKVEECAPACAECGKSKTSHIKALKQWLCYPIHRTYGGYGCTWYGPIWTYFLDYHCRPGWDGWQPCYSGPCCSDDLHHGCACSRCSH
jgi:hypothetical protein